MVPPKLVALEAYIDNYFQGFWLTAEERGDFRRALGGRRYLEVWVLEMDGKIEY